MLGHGQASVDRADPLGEPLHDVPEPRLDRFLGPRRFARRHFQRRESGFQSLLLADLVLGILKADLQGLDPACEGVDPIFASRRFCGRRLLEIGETLLQDVPVQLLLGAKLLDTPALDLLQVRLQRVDPGGECRQSVEAGGGCGGRFLELSQTCLGAKLLECPRWSGLSSASTRAASADSLSRSVALWWSFPRAQPDVSRRTRSELMRGMGSSAVSRSARLASTAEIRTAKAATVSRNTCSMPAICPFTARVAASSGASTGIAGCSGST